MTTTPSPTTQTHPRPRPSEIARGALTTLSTHFTDKNLDALLGTFSTQSNVTYAGSEQGETATGPTQLRTLLATLLARPARYSFTFPTIQAHTLGPTIWVLADGTGHEDSPHAPTQTFPYRITGLLTHEHNTWRWALLTGAEPTPPGL